MITINTLIKLIDNYEEILSQAKSFGYVNLRLFCSYYEENKHKLNFLASFDHSKRQAITYDKDINKILSGLLETEVCLWGEGAIGLKASDYTEAASAPLLNIEQTINYFIDTLIPYSTDEEPVGKNRSYAQQYWQQKTLTKMQTDEAEYHPQAGFQRYCVRQFQPSILSLIKQFSEKLSDLPYSERGQALILLISKNGFSLEALQQLATGDSLGGQPPVVMGSSDL